MEHQTAPYDVFLSYHWRDHDAAERLARTLDTRELRVFLDRWYLTPGLPWPQALEQALERCRAVVICVGPEGMGPWQMREHFLALDRQVREERRGVTFPVIPVLLPGADPPLGLLKLNTWVTLRAGVDDVNALEAIARAARGLPAGKDEVVRARPAICPYRGLQAFREEDAPFFFGREAFSDRLVEEIRHKSFIAVVGASGSGKSSVVRAGLVPRLREKVDGHVWDILTLTPGSRPLHALASTIIPILAPELGEVDRLADCGKLVQHFTANTISLRDAALRCLEKQPGTDRLLLFVDQWEELYTSCRDEEARRWFIDQLLAASADAPATVVLTLRGDFYGRALTHRGLVDRLQDAVVNLGPMTREELRSTLEKPATDKEVGLEFEPGLVDHILDDVGDEPGNLPLLEFMLKELWEDRRGRLLHFEAYEKMKGIKGAIATRAGRIFETELTAEQQQAARRVLMRLVRPGEGTPDTRRRAVLPTEDENALTVVHKLANARLLVTGRDETRTDAQTVEIAHEALIQHWGLLQQWVDEDREFLRTRERIEAAAALWDKEGRLDDRLLAPGRPLAEAEDLLAKRRPDLSPSLVGFIEASTAAEMRRQEALQEAHRQKLKRNRLLAVASILIAVIMAGLGLVALERWSAADKATTLATEHKEEADRERYRALEEREKAVSRALATEASLLVERGPSEEALLRAAALVVESWKRVPNPDAFAVAMNLLQWFPVRRIEADPGTPPGRAGLAFSPDGRFLVIHSYPPVRLIETESGREMTRIEDGENVLPPVCFSSDSRFVSIGRTLINTETCKEVFRASADKFKIPGNFHIDVADRTNLGNMSPDSRWLVLENADSAGNTDGIALIDMHTGKEACRIEHRKDRADTARLWLSFNPDGSLLNIMDWQPESVRLIRLMEVPSGRERARLTITHAGRGYFIGKGQYLVIEVSGGSNRKLHFVDPESGRELSSIDLGEGYVPQFSSDGQRMVTRGDNEVRLLEVPTGKEVARWQECFHWSFFDSNGQLLVLVSQSGQIRLVDTASGLEKSRAELDCEISRSMMGGPVRLRADADLLVMLCKDGEFRSFNASTGAESARFKAKGRVLSFSPDARFIVTQDEDQEVLRFWETTTGQEFGRVATSGSVSIPPIDPKLLMPGLPAFSSDGRYLALPSPAGSVQLVDFSSAYNPLKLDSTRRSRVIFSRDRRLLAFTGSDHVVRVVDMATGREMGALRQDKPAFPVYISPDDRLLTRDQESILRLNQIETGREIARIQNDWNPHIENSPDGNYLITDENKKSAWLIESSSLKEITHFPLPFLYGVPAFSPDGRLLALGDRGDYVVQVIDTVSGKEQLRIGPGKGFGSPRFSPDGKTLAVDGVNDNFVRLFDVSTGTQKMQLVGRGTPNFSTDGRTLAIVDSSAGGKGVFVKLFDVESERELIRVHSGSSYPDPGATREPLDDFNFAFSPDSRLFAVGAAAGDPVQLFEARTGKELPRVELGWGFKGVLFSPDGRTLAAASNNGSVRLLDVESRRVLGTGQHAKAVTHMEFSADSRFLATSGNDGTALMMESEHGKEIARFEHGAPVTQASFSHDGQSLLTVSDDNLKLWPADPEWLFQQLCARAGRNLSREEWRTFIGESEHWQATCPNWHVPDPD
jgi:WD40 repeat protein